MALKSKPKPEKDRSERWLLTYADLITLLMVFFVILYSFSIIDIRRFLSLKGSLDQAFNQGALSATSTTGLNDTVSGSSVQAQIAAANEAAEASLATELQQIAQASGSGQEVTISTSPAGVTLSMAANLLFQSGTGDLKPGAKQLLAQIAQPLRDIQNPIELVANTDDIQPAAGGNSSYLDNWEVGNARAHSVLRTLVDEDKFPEARLSLGNNAQFQPLPGSPNTTAENRARNRRVDIFVVFPRPEDQPIGQPFQIPGPAAIPAAVPATRPAAPAASISGVSPASN